MKAGKKILTGFIIALFCTTTHAQTDTVLYQKDSVIESPMDRTIRFFQENEKVKFPSKTILTTKTKQRTDLMGYLQKLGLYADHALADLDNDGKKELLIYNYTGGAHCCDEIYIYKNIAPDRYQHVTRLFAGNTTINDSNRLRYDFHEQFGYFFTCFACEYDISADEAPIRTRRITLTYKKGVMSIVRGDQDLRSRINDNLAKFGEMPYEELNAESKQDNGQRKEFALNLAVFYYSFGKNLAETQRLFNKYYKFPDAKNVWAEFVKTLNTIRKTSDL